MTYTCPKDPAHQSDDADYCSVCGAKIQSASGVPAPGSFSSAPAGAPSPSSAGGNDVCPDCGTPRHNGARFCEVCRYNYDTRASGGVPPIVVSMPPPPVSAPVIEPTPPVTPIAEPIAAFVSPPAESVSAGVPTLDSTANVQNPQPKIEPSLMSWEISAVVDGSLYSEPDPAIPLPVNEPERAFPLDFAELLIGRRSDRKDIHPEIPLNDPGISHRHAKLLRQTDGSFMLLDVGSTNGTRLNGVEVQPGVRLPLTGGDEITLGCWTRLTVREKQVTN